MRVFILVLAGAIACHPGGEYAKHTSDRGDLDHGETNGRMFDFVSDKPEGDDWQIRVRGTSMWVSYAHENSTDQLGTRTLTDKETAKLWDMVDKVDIPSRQKGHEDKDGGTVTLRLREPGEDQHDIYTVYVSRETLDDEVIELADYLRKLVLKHFNEKPNF